MFLAIGQLPLYIHTHTAGNFSYIYTFNLAKYILAKYIAKWFKSAITNETYYEKKNDAKIA